MKNIPPLMQKPDRLHSTVSPGRKTDRFPHPVHRKVNIAKSSARKPRRAFRAAAVSGPISNHKAG